MPWVCFPNWRSLTAVAKPVARKIGRRMHRHIIRKHIVAYGVTCFWVAGGLVGGHYIPPIGQWLPGSGAAYGQAGAVPGSLWTPSGGIIPHELGQAAVAAPEPSSVAVFFVAVVALLMVQALKRKK